MIGKTEEAILMSKKAMKLNPNFSLNRFEKNLAYKNLEAKNRLIEALRKAGIPD